MEIARDLYDPFNKSGVTAYRFGGLTRDVEEVAMAIGEIIAVTKILEEEAAEAKDDVSITPPASFNAEAFILAQGPKEDFDDMSTNSPPPPSSPSDSALDELSQAREDAIKEEYFETVAAEDQPVENNRGVKRRRGVENEAEERTLDFVLAGRGIQKDMDKTLHELSLLQDREEYLTNRLRYASQEEKLDTEDALGQ
jgi:hypothetical protein